MPKAVVNTKSGAVVTIEGTQEEVVDLLGLIEAGALAEAQLSARRPRRSENGTRHTPAQLLVELIDEGFFSEPKGLGAVRGALQEKGHFYPATTLSPLMLRLVRKKELRRIKGGKQWGYVR
jgi:hypothetical protein